MAAAEIVVMENVSDGVMKENGDEAVLCLMCAIIYFQTILVVYSCLGYLDETSEPAVHSSHNYYRKNQ